MNISAYFYCQLFFNRRLPIICLEDGYLHPSFPILVWCMIASSKGYLLPDYLLSVCVHMIAEVSESKYLDSCTGDDECAQSNRENSDMADNKSITAAATTTATHDSINITPSSPTLPSSQVSDSNRTAIKKTGKLIEYDVRQQSESSSRTLIISIMLRAAFGGMAGDVIMLKKYYSSWFNRLFRDQGGEESMRKHECSSYSTPSFKGPSTHSQDCTTEDVIPFSSPTSSLRPLSDTNSHATSLVRTPRTDAEYGL